MTAAMGFEAIVVDRVEQTQDVISLTLRAGGGSPLPVWSAGDHIDVETPFGIRQYSLCGSVGDGDWTIGVLREEQGRGGSRWLHDSARVGSSLRVGAPRSNFALRPARRYLFLAGGIGITPLLPMIEQACETGADWSLLYLARTPRQHAFAHRFDGEPRARLWATGDRGRPDLRGVLDAIGDDASVYCCGPNGLVDAVLEAAEQCGRSANVSVERFVALDTAPGTEDAPFEIELARSDMTLPVPAERTALDVIGEAGVFVPSSCREGICGSCEVPVLAGTVEHRDSILSASERAENDCFFPCVSRAQGGRLRIDL